MNFKQTAGVVVQCIETGEYYPLEHPAYLAWLAEGNTPEPYVEPPAPIPTVVSSRQARLALLQNNLLDTVEAAIKAGTRQDQITWEFATEVRRDDDLVKNMAVALNLSDAQLDGLFSLAATL